MSDTKFIDGLSVFKPRDNAPDFVKADISIRPRELFEFMKNWKMENPDAEYLRIQVLESKGGKYYAKLDDFKPSDAPKPDTGGLDDDIPF